MSRTADRRSARERALGLLYEAEVKGCSGADILAELPVEPDELTRTLVLAVDEHRDHVDDLIARFARGWALSRMPALDRAALRMGTAELLGRPDVPAPVVLAETVDLAGRFSTDDSGRFVNGLLARVAREVRGADAGEQQHAAAADTYEAPGTSAPTALLDDAAAPADEARPRLVDALVIDLDGVIRHWDTDHLRATEEALGVPAGALGAAAFGPDVFVPAMDGRLSFEDWSAEVGAALARDHGIDAAAGAEAWASTTWRIDLTVVELVDAVRAGGTSVALLSNASTRLEHDLEVSGIAGSFDAVVCSADIGIAKPDPGAFTAAAEALGVPVARCAFVDDNADNVEAALVLGMRAERFDGPGPLHDLLVELGLL